MREPKLGERHLFSLVVLVSTLRFCPLGPFLLGNWSGWEHSSHYLWIWCFEGSGTEERSRLAALLY